MIQTVNFQGVKAIVRNTNFKFLIVALIATFSIFLTACPKDATTPNGTKTTDGKVDPNETAATVNGTAIKLQEIEKVIKQQSQGQANKFSPLELAQARLQVLEQLIQQEVMFQKAQKEETIPKDEDINAELNKMKTGSGVSKEEFEKRLKDADMTENDLKEQLKKQLAISKLLDKITGKVEPPSDGEIKSFYDGNKEAFVKKRGVKLAAIVVDPVDSGQGDTTKDEESAKLKLQEVVKKLQNNGEFAEIASQDSEDPSRLRKGDLGYISEEQMKQTFSPQIAEAFMSEQFSVGGITPAIPIGGKFYIFKLQERILKDEDQTLESPGVRQQITDSLVNARKQLLQASYAAVAMDEAEIVNYLAQKVVENPNELSGARPAGANDDAKKEEKSDANSNANANANAEKKDEANANSEANKDVNAEDKKADTNAEKPANADAKKEEEKK